MFRLSSPSLKKLNSVVKTTKSPSPRSFSTTSQETNLVPTNALQNFKFDWFHKIKHKKLNLPKIPAPNVQPFNRVTLIQQFTSFIQDQQANNKRNLIVVQGGRQTGKTTLTKSVLHQQPLGLMLNLRKNISNTNSENFHKYLEQHFNSTIDSVINTLKGLNVDVSGVNINLAREYNITQLMALLQQIETFFTEYKKETGQTPILFIDEADLLFTIPDSEGYKSDLPINNIVDNHYLSNKSWLKAFLGWCVEQSTKDGTVKIVMASSNGFFIDMINSCMNGYFTLINVLDLSKDEAIKFMEESAPDMDENTRREIVDRVGGRIGDLIALANTSPLNYDNLDTSAYDTIYRGCYPSNQDNLSPSKTTVTPLWTGSLYWHIMERLVECGGSFHIEKFPALQGTSISHNMIRHNLINIFGNVVYPDFPYLLFAWNRAKASLKFTYKVEHEGRICLIRLTRPTFTELEQAILSRFNLRKAEFIHNQTYVDAESFLFLKQDDVIQVKAM